MAKLGEICNIVSGATPKTNMAEYWNGDFLWITPAELNDRTKYVYTTDRKITQLAIEKTALRVLPKGTVLLSSRAPIGKVAITAVEMFCNQGFKNLICTNLIFNEYLFWFLKSKTAYLNSLGRGATFKEISKNIVEKIEIPLPSLEQQHHIVNTLDKINELIDLKKRQLQLLDDLVKARFVELMQTYPSNNLLEEFISAYKAERCGDREIPVLSITKEDGIVFQSEKFKKRIASVDASTYKVVPRGKLVQGIHIDERNFAIQNIADEGIVSPAYKIWNVNEDKAIPEVLAYAMRTDRTMAYISSKFTGSVKRRESISMNDFMTTPIDLPSIKVQTEFYNIMKQTDKSKFVIQKALDEAQLLFDSLMQEYFG